MSTSERISSIEQGVEAVLELEESDIAQPASKRNGNETTLPFTVEGANDNCKVALDLDDESPVQQPSKKGGKGKGKEGRFNWFHEPLVKLSPASLLASLAVILGLSLATYYGVSTASAPTVTITSSENIAAPPPNKNPGTITLNADGGMTISGNVKLTADIEVPGELPSGAAITLLDGSVLDCDYHSIANGSGSTTKYGIKVEGDGAQIKNCDVSAFSYGGADVLGNHVSIENSLFRSNANGIVGVVAGGGTLEMNGVTVSDNSKYGIYIYGWNDVKMNSIETNGNENIGIYASNEGTGTLEMNGVTANDNGGTGIFLSKWEYAKLDNIQTKENDQIGIDASSGGTLEMNDFTAMDNDQTGIQLSDWEYAKLDKIVTNGNRHGIHMDTREVVLEDITAEQNRERGVLYAGGGGLSLKGKNSLSNNGEDGLVIEGAAGATVTVDAKAKVAVNNNGEVGIRVDTDGNANFELAKKGSLDACYNNDFDWEVEAKADANFAGKRYICDDGKINGDGPECLPCK